MAILPRNAELGQAFGLVSARASMAGAMVLFCLMAPRIARAHDDDVPATPATTWTGAALFVLVTLVVLVMAFRARLPPRRRFSWYRYRRRLRRRKP